MLLERVLTLFFPSPWEQSGLQTAMHLMTARLNKELQPVSVNVNDPLGSTMVARGKIASSIFEDFVNLLASRTDCYTRGQPNNPHQDRPLRIAKDHYSVAAFNALPLATRLQIEAGLIRRPGSAAAVATAQSGHTAYGGSPPDNAAAIAWSDDCDIYDSSNPDTNHPLPLQHLDANDDRYQSPLAAFSNRPASIPGQHGVQFLGTSRQRTPIAPRRDDQRRLPPVRQNGKLQMAQMSSPKPKPPDATADRSEITEFIRSNHICFNYAYGLPCNRLARYACPYKHDGDIIPAGFYERSIPKRKAPETNEQSPPPMKRTLVALTPEILAACDSAGITVGEPHADTTDADN